ncbi:hypothetical protein [Thauera sp. 27]|nr:hypothetical protein [Thauera sp. 27]
MDEAIERLEALKAEYERYLKATYQPQRYYEDLEAKVSAIEEAIERLRW